MRNLTTLVPLLLLLLLPAGCVTNPVTGESQFMLVSESGEFEMGDEALPSCIYTYELEYADRSLKRYLGTIVNRLNRCSHRPNMPVDFRILDTSMPNAFALPGHVFITRGLLVLLKDEAQFAAVMGHELGHVTARHAAMGMTRNMFTKVGFGVAGAALGEELGGVAALGFNLFSMRYSRSQEYQADKLGAYYAWRAGYEPDAAVELQETLLKMSGGDPDFLSELFSTHPAGTDRINRLKATLPKLGLNRALIQEGGRFKARWDRRLKGIRATHALYTRYFDPARKALAGDKDRQALELVTRAIRADGRRAPFHRLAGDVHSALGNSSAAQAAYDRALALDARYVQARFGKGRLALRARQWSRAEGEFLACLKLLDGYTGAIYGLGIACHRQGKYKESLEPLVIAVKAGAGPGAMAMVASALDRLGEKEKALEFAEATLKASQGKPVAKDPDVQWVARRIAGLRREVAAIVKAREAQAAKEAAKKAAPVKEK